MVKSIVNPGASMEFLQEAGGGSETVIKVDLRLGDQRLLRVHSSARTPRLWVSTVSFSPLSIIPNQSPFCIST